MTSKSEEQTGKSQQRGKQRWVEGEEEKKHLGRGQGGGRSRRRRTILNPESSQLIPLALQGRYWCVPYLHLRKLGLKDTTNLSKTHIP